jgi:hypothetical protein
MRKGSDTLKELCLDRIRHGRCFTHNRNENNVRGNKKFPRIKYLSSNAKQWVRDSGIISDGLSIYFVLGPLVVCKAWQMHAHTTL